MRWRTGERRGARSRSRCSRWRYSRRPRPAARSTGPLHAVATEEEEERDPFKGASSKPSCAAGAARFDASRVAILVVASNTSSVTHMLDTWYPFARGRAFFVGRCAQCNFSLPSDGRGLTYKVRELLMRAPALFPGVDFFFKLDTDTYLVPECLFDFLGRLDAAASPLYVGFNLNGFAQGGAGYVVSRSALERTDDFTRGRCVEDERRKWPPKSNDEDSWFARCMNDSGVELRNSDRFSSMRLDHFHNPYAWRHEKRATGWKPPSHGLVTLHRYTGVDDYLALHTALRLLHVP